MAKETTILRGSKGLNTRDHPSEIHAQGYLSKAVNVDITDEGSVSRRNGFTEIANGYTNAHSLFGFLDKYAIFADGTQLLKYDSDTGSVTTIASNLTADLPLSYTVAGDMLVYSNGLERGVITADEVLDYDSVFAFQNSDSRQLNNFPMGDVLHFFKGSIYGGVIGEPYLYGSEPYKLNCYDQLRGYFLLGSPLRWVKSVADGLLVGTDKGVTAFAGTGLDNFKERVILMSPSVICSEYLDIEMAGEFGQMRVNGVLTLTHDGIFFITDQLELVSMTSKLVINWSEVKKGSFGQTFNSYIFSGETL